MHRARPVAWNRLLVAALAAVSLASPARAGRLTPELLWDVGRVSGGTISPDGSSVAYLVRRYDLAENEGRSEIRVVDLEGDGDRALVEGLRAASDLQWASTPRGPRLFLVAAREEGEDPQVASVHPGTGELRRVTAVDDGVTSLRVAPTGTRIAFTSRVRIDPGVEDIWPDLPEAEARITDSLLFRHWDRWRDGRYSHLWAAKLGEDGRAHELRDLMDGLRYDCPVPPFGGSEQYDWSPGGEQIAFTMKAVADPARSTDTDVYLRHASGEGRILCATSGREGYDRNPVYSPDGRWIAFHSMERPGFESDRNRILLFDREKRESVELTAGFGRTVRGLAWSPGSEAVWFRAPEEGTVQLWRLDIRSREARRVTSGRFTWRLRDIAPDGGSVLASRQDMLRPPELFRVDPSTGDAQALTAVHQPLWSDLELPSIEERRVRSTDGEKVHCWVILPPGFDRERRWPLLVYCQGGPQVMVAQRFSYRWNFHLMAAKGYVVIAPNRRGLPGYGREWNDAVSRDWGGQAMRDILAATDSVLIEPWIDNRRTAAVGASFGGYTVYWLMGHHERRFRAMIAHAGVFNLESFYGATEELFFADWDLGGPYWKSRGVRADYERFSPHRFVKRWDTPLLVFHGEKDFRVPHTQGIEAFTAARVQGVPARFVSFPGEGHWILTPQNGVLWHRLFFGWLERWCGEEATPLVR